MILFNCLPDYEKKLIYQALNQQLQPDGISSCSSNRSERLSDAGYKEWHDISPFLGCAYVVDTCSGRSCWTAQFEYCSHHVTVDALTPIDLRQSDASALTATAVALSRTCLDSPTFCSNWDIFPGAARSLSSSHNTISPNRILMIGDALIAVSRMADG